MKKFKSFLISISIFLFYTNNVYATTTGRYTVKESSGFGKIFLLIMAIGLVALVLYIGYKMDKNDVQKKRKERIESNKRKQEQKIYDEETRLEKKVINSYNFEDNGKIKAQKTNAKTRADNKKIKTEEIDELEENLVEEFLEEKIIKSIIDDNKEDEKQEFTKQIPTVSDSMILSDSTMVVNTNDIKESLLKHHDDEPEEIEDEVIENDIYEIDEKYEANDEDENYIETEEDDEKDDDEVDYENEDLTRIKNVFEGNIRGYDFDEEDLELLDLEQTIAAANIKKYRKVAQMVKPAKPVKNKKKNSSIIKIDNPNLKRYTRKKQVEEIKPTKRYTRKKKEEVVQSKRFTLKKENKPEKVEKIKRGRKPKVQVENNVIDENTQAKSKRGRRPSNKKEEVKSKRGRKTSTEKKETKSKRGRKPSSKK